MSNLNIRGGRIYGADAAPGVAGETVRGGGILNRGNLTLTDCTVGSHFISAGRGSSAGVATQGGDAEGGAIYTAGTLTLINCTIGINQASSGSGGSGSTGGADAGSALGGGLYNAGAAELHNCTFFSNSVSGLDGGSGTETHRAGNGGYAAGGATANAGSLRIVNATIVLNLAQGGHAGGASHPDLSGVGGDARGAGLLAARYGGEQSTVRNTIIAHQYIWPGSVNDTAGTTAGRDVFGPVNSTGFNLISDATDSSGWQSTDLLGRDPGIQAAEHDNGGAVQTFALRPGSPAIDAGGDAEMVTDARGLSRVFDDPAVANAPGGNGTDIGAFELQPAPPARLANLSARGDVSAADDPLIGGFIIDGSVPRRVFVRGVGTRLYGRGLREGALADPAIELRDSEGRLVAANNDWQDTQRAEIVEEGFLDMAPNEAAILARLEPGAYTFIIRGQDNGTGIAAAEAYDLEPRTGGQLANLSARARVLAGDRVLIAGVILAGGGGGNSRILIRALGPSLAPGVVPLLDPTIAVYDSDGTLIVANDNWKDSQREEMERTGMAPPNDLEAAIIADLPPGAFTAVVEGKTPTPGVSVVETYNLGD